MPDETTKLITEMHTDMRWVKQKLDKLDDKYAAKWTESALKAAIAFVVFGFIGALAGLVFINPARAILIALISS